MELKILYLLFFVVVLAGSGFIYFRPFQPKSALAHIEPKLELSDHPKPMLKTAPVAPESVNEDSPRVDFEDPEKFSDRRAVDARDREENSLHLLQHSVSVPSN